MFDVCDGKLFYMEGKSSCMGASLISGLTWQMQGEGGAYRLVGISAKIGGWLNFVFSLLFFLFAALGFVFGLTSAGLVAEFVGEYDDCDQECQDWIAAGGFFIGMVLLLVFGFIGGLLMVFAKLHSMLALRVAQCADNATGWLIGLGVVSAVFAVYSLVTGDFFGALFELYFAIVFLAVGNAPEVKSQFTVPLAEARAAE